MGLTPTNTYKCTRFVEYDPLNQEVPTNTGGLRWFYVDWNDSDPPGGGTDIRAREAWHVVRVHVDYPTCLSYNELQKMVLQDRHDIIKELRDPDSWYGYSDDNSTTDIGLMMRFHDGDALNKTEKPAIWRLTLQFRVFVREEE